MKTALLLVLFFSLAARADVSCQDLFSGFFPAKTYPAGIDPVADPGGFMQVGYESEYVFSEAAPLLRDYAPRDMGLDQWRALTDEQRLSWLKARFLDKPEYASATGLFKTVALDFMPEELIVDSTGNVEIVLPPFNTEMEWERAVDTIVARYGAGSQQAMISEPREAIFKPTPKANVSVKVKRALGWLVFTNLGDMFAKLKAGAFRYRKDPSRPSASFLDHAFLGPMTKKKRDVMELYLKENAHGRLYDENAKLYVRKSDASFKFTGGPSYRPDIAAPARFSWETRNAHKDVDDLKMKVKRDFIAHAAGLEAYQDFAGVKAFDSEESFARFDTKTQATLKTLFPSKADPRFTYTADDLLALESFRNFAIPLQDSHAFRSLARALTGSDSEARGRLEKQIARARLNYVTGVRGLVDQFEAGKISREQARADVMGLFCLWSVDSGLTDAFEAKAKLIGHETKAVAELKSKAG